MVSDKNGKRFIVGTLLGSLVCLFFLFGSGNIFRKMNPNCPWVHPEDNPKTESDPKLFQTGVGGMDIEVGGNIQSAFYPFSSHVLQVVDESEENRLKFMAKREKVIGGRNLDEINPWKDIILWNYFPPSIPCPYDLVRIGGIGDGGKWVCGLKQIARNSKSRPCVIYSFGVSGDSTFEEELLDSTSCSVFAFDPSVSSMNLNYSKYGQGRVNFFQIGLKSSNDVQSGKKYKSLKEIMSDQGHDWIDILKMDVEGAEFDGLSQIFLDFPESLPFGHFNVEIHASPDQNFSEVLELWNKLETGGLRAFINEFNYAWNVWSSKASKPLLIEYGFINLRHALQAIKRGNNDR